MAEQTKVIDAHLEQIEEILGKSPSWIFRWGSFAILLVLCLMIAVAAFIRYPTTIKGELKLTTKNLPVKVVSKAPGKIEKLFIDRGTVRAGDNLALIENPLTNESANFLQQIVKNANAYMDGKVNSIDFLENDKPIGYLQQDYNALKKKLIEYEFFRNNEYYNSKIKRLTQQITYNQNLISIAKKELSLNSVELKNNEEKFKVDQKLYDSQVLSRVDYLKAENEFVKQQQESEGLKRRIEELNLTSLEFRRQLEDMKFELKQKDLDFRESIMQSLKVIESAVINWQQNYLLQAPIAGKVYLFNNFSEKQHVNANESLFMIVPSVQKYVCMVDVPAKGFGRIKEGQRVRIKLDNYPSHEFGQFSGKVIQVPEIPIEGATMKGTYYRVLVEVDGKGKTTYNKILPFTAEMAGVGEIVTNEQTLLERLFNQVRGRFNDQ